MRARHPLLSVILAALLALTSVTMAVARVQGRMSMAVELCADGAVQTIAVDWQGKPVGPHHTCPDCLMGVTALALPQGATAPLPLRGVSAVRFGRVQVAAQPIVPPQPSARGPPDLI